MCSHPYVQANCQGINPVPHLPISHRHNHDINPHCNHKGNPHCNHLGNLRSNHLDNLHYNLHFVPQNSPRPNLRYNLAPTLQCFQARNHPCNQQLSQQLNLRIFQATNRLGSLQAARHTNHQRFLAVNHLQNHLVIQNMCLLANRHIFPQNNQVLCPRENLVINLSGNPLDNHQVHLLCSLKSHQ